MASLTTLRKAAVRLLWPLLLAFSRPLAMPAAAQTATPAAGPAIQGLRVQVMPEFDDPRLLVIVQGRLALPETAALPRPVTFRLPRAAHINQMAVIDITSGGTLPQPYDARPDPADPRWSLVTYTVHDAHFFYEYYDALPAASDDRQFTYTFSSLLPIGELVVEVQQPRAAADFTLDPAATARFNDPTFGLTVHRFDLGALAAGAETAIAVSYAKTDPSPSFTREEVAARQLGQATLPAALTIGEAAPGRPLAPWPLWLALVVALAAGGGGLLWYGRRRSALALSAGPANFCARCGAALRPKARFCHACGAPAR